MDVPIPCVCPEVDGVVRHPDGDVVTIRDHLDFRTAASMRASFGFAISDDERGRSLELLGILTEAYVLFGVASWTVVDDRGRSLDVSHMAIRARLLTNLDAASLVADAADKIYAPVVLFPLLNRASMSSPPTSTNGSTFRKKASPPKRRTRSSRSSISTIPTDATGTTTRSPDGGSSTSQNETSAA